MGEIAELVLDGYLCEVCTGFIDGQETGYPRKCNDCKEEEQ